jgi:hypothetical protein
VTDGPVSKSVRLFRFADQITQLHSERRSHLIGDLHTYVNFP